MLDGINFPKDIKNLTLEELSQLAKELRVFLVKSVSKTGGHLSSNLGVVELTLALHYCFDLPKDKIIWDVGHQSYIHKILTGRKSEFSTLRQAEGLSGFPKRSESEYDVFNTGHSSTSISAALGLAVARDMRGSDENIIAVIGDGSLTGGLAYEALNNAGLSNTNLIIIVNDNEMSISGNVGAVCGHLNKLRLSPSYWGLKKSVHDALGKIPVAGAIIDKTIENTKDAIKYVLLPGVLFEEMGLKYFGPIDGHDIESLIEVFSQAAQSTGPIVIHLRTKKGKGYTFAENAPCTFHGVEPFDFKTGTIPSHTDPGFSEIFGETIISLGNRDKSIVAITAAMTVSTGLLRFKQRYPDRFFDVGIAEQHAVTFSAGLAIGGHKPVFAVYSTFLQRAYDEILHDVCIQNAHVVFAVDRAGIAGRDGETHQGVFDLSFLSHMPNITVMSPKNGKELSKMLEFALFEINSPVALRYPRSRETDFLNEYNAPLEYGKWEVIKEGEEIALIFEGAMTKTAIETANLLESEGKKPWLINARFIKPLDIEGLKVLADRKIKIFTLEENVRTGGFGSAVQTALLDLGNIALFGYNFGLPDRFIEHGSREELLKKYGLSAEKNARQILESI
ncbi:MAG: 1-deoxy-D-xylulose-5-phosphate synthase [Firmicutes bacterium]|nr:1-deoxy-D-xylulose-5-phosphate synthase [Bacillota bacterium]